MSFRQEIIKRNNISILGTGDTTMVLAHGFGCDQNMWRFMLPMLTSDYTVVLFDYVGSGQSDLSAYDPERYNSLEGYAEDVLDICEALELEDIIFVGHSVSSMIGLIASIQNPSFFSRLVMVCPSPCFLNMKPDYKGGFEAEDLEELLGLMDKNYIGWANYLAPLVMGTSNEETLIGELSESFCSTDPAVTKVFARATFFSDHRHILADAQHPVLIFQSSQDALAAVEIGDYMAKQIPQAELSIIQAQGHCLHMTHPHKVFERLLTFLASVA